MDSGERTWELDVAILRRCELLRIQMNVRLDQEDLDRESKQRNAKRRLAQRAALVGN